MKHKQSDVTIYVSNDYGAFKKLQGNRLVGDNRVTKIVESINKVGYMPSPIIVNEKMEIIDGQGRVAACERLKLPVYYVIKEGADIKSCISMNIHQGNWKLDDYIYSYAIQGNESYQRLHSLINQFKTLPIHVVALAATEDIQKTPGGDNTKQIKNGKLEISKTKAERARWQLDYAAKMREVAKKIGGGTNAFYLAVIYAYINLDSDGRNRMESVIRKHAFDFPQLNKTVDYLRHFDGYYNETVTKKKQIKLATQWEVDLM